MDSAIYARKRLRHLPPASHSIMSIPPSDTKLGLTPPLPMTPPDPDADTLPTVNFAPSSIDTVVHVISTECAALANLERLYTNDKFARSNMERAVEQVASTIRVGGKLVICGVGKSGKIGEKIVATMNSLGVQSTFLHPTEALHGDLGVIRQNDTILFVTFSGKTSELQLLIPHLPSTVSIIALTAHTQLSSCTLLTASLNTANAILLPAPVHEHEEISFGLSAPTTSTTVALTVGDALALATARRLHNIPGRGPAEVFKGFHPGGAIGAASASNAGNTTPLSNFSSTSFTSPSTLLTNGIEVHNHAERLASPKPIINLATPFSIIPDASPSSSLSPSSSPNSVTIVDILRTAIQCPKANSWVRLSASRIIPPHQLRTLAEWHNPNDKIIDLPNTMSIGVDRTEWIFINKKQTVQDARQILDESLGLKTSCNHADAVAATTGTGSKRKLNLDDEGDDGSKNPSPSSLSSTKMTQHRIVAVVDDVNEDGHILGVIQEEDI